MSPWIRRLVTSPSVRNYLAFLCTTVDQDLKGNLTGKPRAMSWGLLAFTADPPRRLLLALLDRVLFPDDSPLPRDCTVSLGAADRMAVDLCAAFVLEKTEAETVAREAPSIAFEPGHLHGALADAVAVLQFLGRFDLTERVLEVWSRIEEAQRETAVVCAVGDLMFKNVGHFLLYAALVIAEQRAGRRKTLLVSDRLAPANRYLYDRLAQPIAPQFTVDRDTLNALGRTLLPVSPTSAFRNRRDVFVHPTHGSLPYRWDGAVVTMGGFIRQALDAHFSTSGAPLIQITADERARVAAMLARNGIDPTRPIVTLHVRESGFDPASQAATELRNASIDTYRPAVAFLVAQGHQVVRLGDPSMAPLGSSESVFDYAHSPDKSEMADIVLASLCSFHIGTSSGMSHVPLLFDRPVLYTNWLPFGEYVATRRCRVLTKTVLDWAGRTVPRALCDRVFANTYAQWAFKLKGCTVRDNTSEEILAGVREMLTAVDTGPPASGRVRFVGESDRHPATPSDP
jgi:putative glycosyltransferase (TIGR04372 family)